ncbi:hypothetical protein [Methylorubrum salsuginis]|uniref:Uncharacterized protein n=1 Tax=Methylorubrum salsuginis TaxID=414703 RepID=A0A1I4C967_9HYPH|nr:hypothetical protein [Methylorubrum salsuginis]SFK77303.1 hypothetical protein SAMN04488125_104101 [Methylorubrum salsuginis]
MRLPALAILIALAPSLAAADDAFRARLSEIIAEQGGCAESRALVEGELAAFERARKGDETGQGDGKADETAPLLLFGKPAAAWSGENIRDLVAVIRACEAARPGQSRNAEERERRLTERMDRLAQAMRRAVVLSRRPPEIEETSANPTLRSDALPEAAGGGAAARRTGRRGAGPAFVPLDGARAAQTPPEGERRAPARAAAHASAAVPPSTLAPETRSAPAAATAPSRREAASDAPQNAPRAAFAPGAALSIEPAFRPGAAPAEAAPPRTCLVTRERFERIRTGMSLKEVEGLFGCRGRLDSAVAIDGLGTFEVYVWSPPSQAGSVTVTFQNRRLTTKVLRGMS